MDREKGILCLIRPALRNSILGLYALFALFPLIWMVILSFKPDDQMFTSAFVFTPTLENFRAVLGEEGFLRSLWSNLLVSSLAVVLTLIVGVLAAYALGRYQVKGRESIAFTFLLCRFAPEILVIIPLYLIYRKLGLIDSVFGLVWVYQLITLPLFILTIRGFFEDISPDIERAAQLDGYSRWQVFFGIFLPTVKPGIIAASLLCFIFSWNSFTFALLLGGTSAQTSTVSVTKFLASEPVHYGWVAAAGVVSALPVLILVLFIRKYLVRGLSFGLLKD
jgi:multiple sugar transport system permease protein